MKIQRMPEDIVPLLNDLVRRLTALETRPLGTVFVNETIIAKDPESGVETVIGDLSEYGEDRTGIKQWVNDTEPPAVPVMPIVTSNLGVFSIVWTGFFEDDGPMAPDFSHLNVYGNNGTSTKLVGVIKTKDEVAIVTLDSEAMYDEVWSFWFTSVDQVGNESVPGPISANNQLTPLVESPDIQGAIDDVYEKIQQDFEKSMLAANGKNRIWHTPEPPVEDPNAPFIDGDMWFDTNNGNKIHVWKNLPEPGAWEAAVLDSNALDDKVTDLIQEAKDQSDTAISTANGKNKAWHRPTAPTGTNHTVGDLWFDTANDNRISTWDGTKWVLEPIGAKGISNAILDSITNAQNTANSAQTSANGKNTNYYSPNAPTAPSGGFKVGDAWFDTDDGNRVYVWTGTKWDSSKANADIAQSVLDDILYAKNKSDQAYSLANGKNKRVDSVNNPPANTTGYIAGDHWLKWSNLGTTGVLLQSWTVKNGAWVKDSMDPTYLPKVDIGQGTFGSLNGDRLFANTVSAEKILIGSFDNVIADPLFTNNAEDWLVGTSSIYTFDPTGGRGGISSIKITPNGATSGRYSKRIPAEAGDSFRVTVWVKSDVVIPKYMVYSYANRIAVGSTGVSNAEMLVRNAEDIPANTWYLLEGNYTVPENTSNIGFGPFVNQNFSGNSVWFSEMSAIRMTGATLIEDESITTPKIKAGAITADSGIIASLDAGKISTGEMEGRFIKAGTILASRLAVTDFLNYNPNMLGQVGDWQLTGGTTIVSSGTSADGKRFSFPLGSPVSYAVPSYYSDVLPGDKISVRFVPQSTTSTSVLELYWQSDSPAASGILHTSNSSTSANTTPVSVEFTVPANTNRIKFGLRTKTTNAAIVYAHTFVAQKMTSGTLIEDGAITTNKIKVGAITADSGIIASLDAGKITTGQMHGKYIEAGTLLASKLAVRNNENLLPNLTYEAEDWVLSGGTTIVNSTLSPEGKRLSFPPTALAQAIAYDVQVIPGEKYKVEANTYGTTASQNLEICWFGKDGKGVGAGSSVLIKSTTANQKLSTEWEVPANVFSVRFSLRVPSTSPVNTATTGAYNFTVRKMTGTVLIENGAVTADQIKSGTITADSGVIASLDASKITVGEMDGKLIKINSILADRLVVGDFENYATVDPVLGTNVSHSSYKTGTVGEYASAIGSGAYFMFRDPSNSVPFELGDKLRVTFDAKSSNTSNQNVTAQLWTYLGLNGGGGGASYFPGTSATITPTEKRYEMFIEVTSDISAAKSWIVGLSQAGSKNVLLRNITVRRMAKGELIVDGAILANHIHADAVEARHIKANAVTADKIEAGAIKTSHLAVGTGRELVGNGSGQLKNNTGFESFKYGARTSSTPVGHPGYFYSTAGQGTTNFLTGDNLLRIKPNTKYKISVWIRANATGSRVYLEPMVGSTVAGERPIPTYAFSDASLSTSWEYWQTEITTTGAPSGTMYFRWFLNHSNGTNTNAIIYFTGFSVEEMVEGTIISDNSITTGKLMIGSFDNLIPDPTFVAGKDAWNLISGSQIVDNASSLGGPVLRITSASSHQTVNSFTSYPVAGGESFNLKMRVKTSVAAPVGSLWVFVRAKNRDTGVETYPYVTNDTATVANKWMEFSGNITLPANTSSVIFSVSSRSTLSSGYVDYEFVSATRASSGELIVDGSITADKIAANTITAEKMTIGVGTNLFPDPLIKDLGAWNNAHSSFSVITNGGRNASGNALRITAASGQTGGYFGVTGEYGTRRIPVVPGRSYRITTWIKPSVATTVGANIAMYFRLYPETGVPANKWTTPSSGTAKYVTDVATISNTVWTKFEVEVMVPSDTDYTFLTPGFYLQSGYPTGAYVDWCDISVTEMSSGELIVDGAIDGKTITGALIQTDKASNVGVKLSNSGIEAYSPQGEKTFSITAGQGVDYIGVWGSPSASIDDEGNITYPAGVEPEQMASLDYLGGIAGSELSISDYARFDGNVVINGDPLTASHLGSDVPGEWGPVINGRSLLGKTFVNAVEEHPDASDVNSWLTFIPHGVIVNTAVETPSLAWDAIGGVNHERSRLGAWVDFVSGRMYSITYRGPGMTISGTGAGGASYMSYGEPNKAFTIGSGTNIRGSRLYLPAGQLTSANTTTYIRCPEDIPAGRRQVQVRIYVYSGRTATATSTSDAARWELTVADMGLRRSEFNGNALNLSKQGTAVPTPPPNPPKPTPVQKTKTWNASWWATYWVGNGDGINSGMKSPKVAQGKPPGVSYRQRGAIGFPDMIGTLSGSTIKKVEVYVYATHWYSSGGGTLEIGTHGHKTKPSKMTEDLVTNRKSQALKKPEGRWVTLPSVVHAGIMSGSVRGIQAYTSSTSLSKYGYLDGKKSKIRVTYVE